MQKAMTLLYKVHDNIYVNLTNKCPCACTFCLRQTRDHMEASDVLWLEHDVTREELLDAFENTDLSPYPEVVFCGFGEPMEALDVLLAGAKYIKDHYPTKPVRINTNGQGNLIHGKDITPLLEGLVDTVSISLDTPDPDQYQRLVRSKFGAGSFDAMIDFAKKCTHHVPHVVMTTVETTISHEDEEKCRKICQSIGAHYRIRAWEG